MKWNDIPYDQNATPEEKGVEFDLQYEENKQSAPEDNSNPYEKK